MDKATKSVQYYRQLLSSPKMHLATGKLSVPITLWGEHAPSHRISAISCLPDQKTLLTGTIDGQICIWDRNTETEELRPKYLLFGHPAPVLCLSAAGLDTNCSRFVSCCRDRKMCLWESKDGRCVESSFSNYIHTAIEPHLLRIDDKHSCVRLFCRGEYPEILVIDPQDLQVLFTLSSRVEPDWMAAFCILKPAQRCDIVIGLSQAGMVKIWTLSEVESRDMSRPIYEDESKQVKCQHALTLSACTFNQRTMLVVSAAMFQIFDASDFSELLHHPAPTGFQWQSGVFTKIDKVAMHCSDGNTYLYQLPRNALAAQDKSKSLQLDRLLCYCILKADPKPKEPMSPVLVTVNDIEQGVNIKESSVVASFFHSYLSYTSQFVFRGDQQGSVNLWQVPDVADKAIGALAQENFIQSPELQPIRITSLEDAWKHLNTQPAGIVAHLSELSGDYRTAITSTLYVASQGRLFIGRSDGSITFVSGTQTIARQLLDVGKFLQQKGPDWPGARVFRGHSGAVTCLVYPFEHSERYENSMLVSGGQDCAVCVWDLNTGVRVSRFCVQAGPIQSLSVPPEQCNTRILNCVCSVATDHSVALLSPKEQKCILLASRHLYPVKQIRWRPLDDFLLVQTFDGTVHVWQMETASLDRVLTGVLAEEVLAASDVEPNVESSEIAGASSAVQMFRALKNKNIAVIKKIAGGEQSSDKSSDEKEHLAAPLTIKSLKTAPTDPDSHLVIFNVEALIVGLLLEEHCSDASDAPSEAGSQPERGDTSPLLSGLLAKARDKADAVLGAGTQRPTEKSSAPELPGGRVSTQGILQTDSTMHMDVAQLLLSLLHAWHMDKDLDHVCTKKLGLIEPKRPICFGIVNRHGELTLTLPTLTDDGFANFASKIRWQQSGSLSTQHLLSVVSTANTLMTMQHAAFTPERMKKRRLLRRLSSTTQVGAQRQTELQTLESLTAEQGQIKQGWSLLAALHCVLLPELVKNPPYKPPRIELLARRWQDRCLEIREASQALLLRELSRVGSSGRKQLIDIWTPYLPPLLRDSSISIFGAQGQPLSAASATEDGSDVNALDLGAGPRHGGIQQMRRNQATAIVLLGLIGAEFGQELCMHQATAAPEGFNQTDHTLARGHQPKSVRSVGCAAVLLYCRRFPPLRRAAIDLLGRGFAVWQPYLDLTRVLIALLDICHDSTKILPTGPHIFPLSPHADACRTARHAMAQIATTKPPAFITALSKEVARYNSAAQHQTLQHVLTSPLLRSRHEVLRIIDLLAEKQYSDVAELMVAVGEILVHTLDTSLLKHKSLAEVFPPITKFHMVSYCVATRRIAFGGKTGAVVIHELRAGKAQTIQAHSKAVTAISFSEDGKHLATYSADEGKLNFWQASQSFLGMGQSQIKVVKQVPAPTGFPVATPGGTAQIFRARIQWISAKALALLLPNGKEHRFSL